MKKQITIVLALAAGIFLINCNNPQDESVNKEKMESDFKKMNVYGSQEAYGEHLVILGGCNDCHTPKKMGPRGPELDSTKLLSGHPAKMPPIDVDRKAMAAKGIILTQDLTEWVGPWGISYTANLTPDETGIATWTIDQFKNVIRHGKYHGMMNGRDILPPMPWEMYQHMSDDEIAAIFAYLKTIPAVSNQVPPPVPPAQ
jgi:mono/diheme cytochrome c family protein